MTYQYRPRKSFERSLTHLAQLDSTIVDETRAAILILLAGDDLPNDFQDHKLEGNYTGYREFHLRDTSKGQQPTEINDILVIYKIDNQDLVLVTVDIGSHSKLFRGRYRKNK
ncbi:type II toxin-antitoxin system YafQ family toxin [Companilactobacillus futsaii]|uniref:Type II toxin-antitoxin system YafQ family toxin n=2 Tax=Companilactobacillus futsaii TaxID=938155 RepID=A0A5B7T1N7_9LACO|nr:type II toxin-antitoxin system YafQ family toxin [Companilactobacillus futsaii]KRK96843.1 addiction module toxin, RelE StbE family [Companilactobacillus futsaii JCM 17355]QCX25673.1 type II toxin-antitoxin system YafQ family toxin [Companilactobacillus futsaii]